MINGIPAQQSSAAEGCVFTQCVSRQPLGLPIWHQPVGPSPWAPILVFFKDPPPKKKEQVLGKKFPFSACGQWLLPRWGNGGGHGPHEASSGRAASPFAKWEAWRLGPEQASLPLPEVLSSSLMKATCPFAVIRSRPLHDGWSSCHSAALRGQKPLSLC